MPTYTSNFGLSMPLVSSSTDGDIWGGELNSDIQDIDGLVISALNFITSAQTATFSVIAPTSSSTTTGSSKTLFLCNATSAVIVPALPAASTTGNGFTVAFKKTDSSANTVTVTANNTDTIDGVATFVLSTQYSWLILVSDGVSNWKVISDFASTAGLPTLAGSNTFTGTNIFTTQAMGTSNTTVATTAFANPSFTNNGTEFSVTLPGGLIIKGTEISGSAGGNWLTPTTWTFGSAFPTKLLAAAPLPVGTPGTYANPPLYATAASANSITLTANLSNVPVFCIAFGY